MKLFFKEKVSLPLLCLLLCLFSFGIYANSLSGGFIWDDHYQVLDNRLLRSFENLPEIFFQSTSSFMGGESNYYRPLVYLWYLPIYQIFGPTAWAFHLGNLFFYGLTNILILGIGITLLGKDRWLAVFIGVLFFASHPIHTEPVNWIAGFTELSFSLFFLLAFWFYIKHRLDAKASYLIYATAAFFCSLLLKETAVTLLPVIVVFEFCWKGALASGRWVKALFPLAGAFCLYFSFRMIILKGIPGIQLNLFDFSYWLNLPKVFFDYVLKIIYPAKLSGFYEYQPITQLKSFSVFLLVGALLALIGFSWFLCRKHKKVFFGLLFFVLTLLPAVLLYQGLAAIDNSYMADRYLYLPSFGVVLMVWFALSEIKISSSVLGLCMVVIFAFSVMTFTRNQTWESNLTFWTDAAAKAPESSVPQGELGYALLTTGKTKEAVAYLKKAISLGPDRYRAYNNLGIAYSQLGKEVESLNAFKTAVSKNPGFVAGRNNLGIAYGRRGSAVKAIEQFNAALQIDPYYADSHANIAEAYLQMGQTLDAVRHYQRAVALSPENLRYQERLSLITASLNGG
ncbi:MAG: tetratricopeptide repeat protein [Desulfuromonadales bacterium]|nr:tetratricopeptide repeat protein [Desulfuromonadales bacterium]